MSHTLWIPERTSFTWKTTIFFGGVIAQKFREAGYEMTVVPDGETGLAELRGSKYDLILLDLLMPKMDGFEVLSKLKEDGALSAIPVIAVSNLGNEDDINKAKGLGASVFVVKAISSPEDILAMVDQVLTTK